MKKIQLIVIFIVVLLQGYSMPKIILKLDDLSVNSNVISCNAVMDLLVEKQIKANFGIIASRCDNTVLKSLIPYLNATNSKGEKLFEFWHHGLDHKNPEFGGQPYDYQKTHFEEADKLFKQYLGFQMHTFGAPFNANDTNTVKVVSENPNYKVTLFGHTPPDSSTINLTNRVNIEKSTANPSYSTFVQNYNAKKSTYTDYMVLQAHPNGWSKEKLNEFEQTIDFLIEEGCEFVSPYEYYLSLQKDTTISSAVSPPIKNGVLWRDTDGNRIQAHGVSIMKHEDVYYMLGEDRTDPWVFNGVNLYASTDLVNWEFKHTIINRKTNSHLENRERIIERPCLLYNEKYNRFVVWVKYQNASYTNNKAAIFYCDSIDGDYSYLKEFYPGGYDSNDDGIFMDTDGVAYYISTCKEKKSLNLYKLSEDYFDVETSTILFEGENKEAPVIFKKDNLYYMLCSAKTGWDPNQMKYCTSQTLTGDWTSWQNVGNRLTFDTQPTDVVAIQGTYETSFIYVGDRWKDPKLPESKTIMLPLEVAGGRVDLKYTNEFTVNFNSGVCKENDNNSYVPQDNWGLVSVSSQESIQPASLAFDNNTATFWQSNLNAGDDELLHDIVIDLGNEYAVTGLVYIPRLDNLVNGMVREFQLFLSTDGENWQSVAGGWIGYWSEIHFAKTQARYMKFACKSEIQDWQYVSVSELRLMTNNDYVESPVESYYKIDDKEWSKGTEIKVTEGSSVKLGPQPNSYGSYSWSGPVDFHANTREILISDIKVRDSGIYTICYLDDRNNCHTKVISIEVDSLLSSIHNMQNLIRVFPNPVNEWFLIEYSGLENAIVYIYDFNGKLVYKKSTDKQKLYVTNRFNKGTYLIKIIDEKKQIFHQKLIVS